MRDKTLDSSEFQKTLLCSTLNEEGEEVINIDDLSKVLNLQHDNTIKRFQNVKTIGIGGIGTVLSGRESSLKRDIAIKILRPAYRNKKKFLNRFIREARATAQIEHPNIVPVHELGLMGELGIYFTMKKVEGENLRTVIHKLSNGDPGYVEKYTLNRLLEIFMAACNGVAFAHSKGIIHRDLKPANIMLGDFGEVMVMDWGLVKYIGDSTGEDSSNEQPINIESNIAQLGINLDTMATLDGSISGTPAFMSPEQAGGRINDINERSDLYSLGAILYSILTLRSSPFEEKLSTAEVLSHVVNNYFMPPRKRAPKRKIPRELEAVCLKAMQRKKEDRYGSVKDLIRDLRNYLDNFPVSAYPEPLFNSLVKLCRRRPLVPLVLVVSIITFMTVTSVHLWENNSRTESYLRNADHCINQGNVFLVRAKNIYIALNDLMRQAQNEDMENRELRLWDDLSRAEAEFNNQYEMSIDYLSKIQTLGMKPAQIALRIAKISKDRLEFSILTGNYSETRKLIEMLRMRDKNTFKNIIENDAQLFESTKMIIQNEGKITVNANLDNIPVTIYKANELNAFMPNTSNIVINGKTPLPLQKIEEGSYVILFRPAGGVSIRYPIRIYPAKTEKINIFIPGPTPSGMAYVPAGPILNENIEIVTGQERRRNIYVQGFFIRKRAVSFAEYLKFWKALQNQNEKRKFLGKYIPDGDDRNYQALWDKNGILREPFKLNSPVIGITGQAAKAYCQWLSQVNGIECRLPNSNEWEKASIGMVVKSKNENKKMNDDSYLSDALESQDKRSSKVSTNNISLYGVSNVDKDIREFTTLPYIGVSGFLIRGSGNPLNIQSTSFRNFSSFSDGSSYNNVGFRYVIPVHEPNSADKRDTNPDNIVTHNNKL
jgi:serine/threonine protein kinase